MVDGIVDALAADERVAKAYDLWNEMREAICRTYQVRTKNPRHLAYFEQASQTYLHYLTDRGDLELVMAEDQLRYRRVNRRRERLTLPPTGRFR